MGVITGVGGARTVGCDGGVVKGGARVEAGPDREGSGCGRDQSRGLN